MSDYSVAVEVAKHGERINHHDQTLGELKESLEQLKDSLDSLLETSRNQSHVIDGLLKRYAADNVSDRMKVLERALDRAQFMWKLAFGVVSSPMALYIGYQLITFFQAAHSAIK